MERSDFRFIDEARPTAAEFSDDCQVCNRIHSAEVNLCAFHRAKVWTGSLILVGEFGSLRCGL